MLRIFVVLRVFARRFDSFLLHTSLNYHRIVRKLYKPFKNFCYFYSLNRSFSKIVIFVILNMPHVSYHTNILPWFTKTTPFYIFVGHENTHTFSFMYWLFCIPHNSGKTHTSIIHLCYNLI